MVTSYDDTDPPSGVKGDVEWSLDHTLSFKDPNRIELVPDPLNPPAHVLIKLGSIIVHMEEKDSARGHWMDQSALDTVRNDPAVIEWMDKMTKMAFLPVKR